MFTLYNSCAKKYKKTDLTHQVSVFCLVLVSMAVCLCEKLRRLA